jgi:hypothetical protein
LSNVKNRLEHAKSWLANGIIITDYNTRGSIFHNVSDNPHIFDGQIMLKPLLDAYIPYQITINQCIGAKDSQGMSSS